MKFKNLINSKLSVLILGMVLGVLAYGAVSKYYLGDNDRADNSKNYETRSGESGLTNPLLDCQFGDGLSQVMLPFKKDIVALINQKIQNGDISYASVYFRDLNNGPWFGINEHEKFIPASLMKVPVMIAVYKKAESDPQFLNKTVVYKGPLNNVPASYFKPREEMVAGNSYAIDELVNRMIIYSDNNAYNLLIMNMGGPKELDEVFKLIGGDFSTSDFLVTTNGYSSFFRILFNSSYLSRSMSEKALQLLTNTSFDPGFSSGAPPGIKVADKFGEKASVDGSGKELHDCGIVYFPNRPYILCTMTRGDNFDKMAGSISDIAKAVYQEIDSQF